MKPPDPATLHDWRVVGAIMRSGVFDQVWYLNNNPDVAAAGINPIRHYLSHGAREGRNPSPEFSTHDYLIHNPDVAAAGINPLVHFVLYGVAEGRDRSGIMMSALSRRRSRLQLQVRQSIVQMTLWNRMSFKTQNRLRHLVHRLLPQHVFDYLFPRGFASKEVTRKIEIDYSVAVPFGYHPLVSVDRIKLAVICHIYFEGLAVEIQRYLRNIPFPFDIFISTDTPAKQEKLQTLFADWNIGSVEIRLVANRGRDIAPKLIGFRDVYDRYEYVLHFHSKSSEHGGVLKHWRGFLLENLVGSRELVESIFAAFIRHQNLGIIGSQHFELVRHVVNWGGNFECAEQLAGRMGIALSIDKVLDFPAGSMFWARSAALRPLLDLNLSFRDFPRETGQIDGTLAHAIERLYYFVCEKAGFTWIKVARPELFDLTPAITTIGSPEALDRYMAEKTLKLTGPVLPEQRREPLPGLAECSRGLINRRQASALGSDLSVDTTVRLTIGIVTYENTSLQIRRIVASARQALTQAGLERNALILMIDNGTSTEPFLTAHDGVRYFPSEGNIGFAAGQNRLITAAFAKGTDIYIAANPDGIFHPNAIKSIVQMMQAQNNHSLIEAIQFPLEHPKEFNPTTFETPWASAACLAIPREIFRKIGGFDETLFMYCEDVDLSWRARASGFAVHICPRAIFLHPVTNRPRDPEVLRMMFNSGVILARKWGNRTFERGLKEELHRLGFQLPHIHPDPVPPNWRNIADFSHRFSFAETRW